jgi:beta-lactam-binding protein with PASTA domain
MADVYLARDQQLGRPVAVKVLFPEYARDPSFVERFRREAKNSAMLQHPNIVSVYDYGQERGTYFIVMEFVDGPSLRDVLHADGALPIMQAARIGSEIAAALDFADRHGVVHRDIKPGNVMIMPSGQVKVTDFGISANPMDANHGLTQTGAVIGTATYFSPEQAQGFQVDGRSDVYALGVVLYEMVTGQAPFSAESPVAVAMKHVREDPIPPSQLRPDVPPDLERIILKALSKGTQSRYQSAGELRADLIRFGRGQAVEAAVPPPVVEQPTEAATQYEEPAHHGQMWDEQPKRRGPIIATVIGLGLLAGAIIFAIFFLGNNSGGGGGAAKVAVPDVVTQKYTDAVALLEKAGFKVVRRDEVNDAEVETVIRQSPEAGIKLEKGGTVRVTVSSNEVTIPTTLVGQTFEQAQAALAAIGLVADPIDQESPDQAAGVVLSTNPAGGTKVAKGTHVQVTRAALPAVAIPSVAGQDQNAASAALTAAGFSVTVVPTPSDSVATGKAIGTTPPSGTKVPKGSAVSLQISTGPTSVAVPSVVGQSCSAGAGQLTGAGFNVAVNGNTSGTVVSQNPSGGTAPPGSQVAINCT